MTRLRNVGLVASISKGMLSELLGSEFVEVAGDIVDAFFVHGYSLLKHVEGSGDDVKLTHYFLKGLS